MYKCGWNGCEKAYGTLNHLNAHVTMQSHGSKRTPEGESSSVHFMTIRPRELRMFCCTRALTNVVLRPVVVTASACAR